MGDKSALSKQPGEYDVEPSCLQCVHYAYRLAIDKIEK